VLDVNRFVNTVPDRMRRSVRACLLGAVALTLPGCSAHHTPTSPDGIADAASRFAREWDRVADGQPEFRARLAARPLAFFRFVNQAWTREVCEAFASEAGRLPSARLHGDAHIEQYAVTDSARGLDDFDDSARGPAVVDIVRFLGSLELAAGQRGWSASLPGAIDAFVAGYRRALADPSYLPPDPAVVKRIRAAPERSATEFLAWTDSLMEAPSEGEFPHLDISWQQVETLAAKMNPEFTPSFLVRKKFGWIRVGIGSALTPKILIRIEGPSPAPDDDLVIEAKEVGAFATESCVSILGSSEALRAVEGLQQIGRLQQRLLFGLPGLGGKRTDGRGWWVKTWDRTMREVTIDDFRSPSELQELAHDVGAQLGSTNLVHPSAALASEERLVEREAVTRLESRIRRLAHDLTAALLRAWEQGRNARHARRSAPRPTSPGRRYNVLGDARVRWPAVVPSALSAPRVGRPTTGTRAWTSAARRPAIRGILGARGPRARAEHRRAGAPRGDDAARVVDEAPHGRFRRAPRELDGRAVSPAHQDSRLRR